MRWVITGAGGMLGTDLTERLRTTPGMRVRPFTRSELDLCDAGAVAWVLRAARPDVVVNCAAWTAVDDAETREKEALAINGTAVSVLARVAADLGARLIQLSTDYVFDGAGVGPYRESAPTGPINAYGRTKLAGEHAALEHGHHVVRTAWLYGAHGRSFARTMVGLEASRPTVSVVDDQFGQPTWTGDLAERIVQLGRADAPPGVYHGTSAGRTSWYDYARELFSLLGADPSRVGPIPSTALRRPAPRPANSVLAHGNWQAAGLPPMREWSIALHAAWPALLRAWGARVVGQTVGVGGE
ncbi:dTDP-4-dehydrorhamnose reductase [Nonomuraea sp. NPDC052129]|uniref:dTDP-4-dehydrorhamnose reductase n=1 Tax=Nonomuraea sp. NPDC052129 TaxID=3154651 RepID=UPI0034221107